jgi:hypothetical protein
MSSERFSARLEKAVRNSSAHDLLLAERPLTGLMRAKEPNGVSAAGLARRCSLPSDSLDR